MDVLQALSLAIVLLLALCGCAHLLEMLSEKLLMPQVLRAKVLLPLSGHAEDAEQQIRAAQALSKKWKMPLTVIDEGMDEETRRITQKLLLGGGELIVWEDMEKMAL